MYVCFWDVERSWWRQRCLAGSAQFPSFFSCRPAEQQHIPSSLGEGAENLTARSFNERVVGKKRTYFESTSMFVYTYHIYLYVCIRIVYMFFIVVAYSVFRKPEKWSTETQTVVLLFSSKDQLQKLKRQGWTFWMYILKLTYVFYLSIHVCNTVTYLFVNLKIFDVHTDTWGPGTVAAKTWVFVEHRLCQAMRMLNQHQGLFWFRSHQNYIPSWSVLSYLLWYTAWISIIFIFLYHIIIYITDLHLLAFIPTLQWVIKPSWECSKLWKWIGLSW